MESHTWHPLNSTLHVAALALLLAAGGKVLWHTLWCVFVCNWRLSDVYNNIVYMPLLSYPRQARC